MIVRSGGQCVSIGNFSRYSPETRTKLSLKGKGQGHVTVNKPIMSRIYIVANTWPLCSVQILVDGVNPH